MPFYWKFSPIAASEVSLKPEKLVEPIFFRQGVKNFVPQLSRFTVEGRGEGVI